LVQPFRALHNRIVDINYLQPIQAARVLLSGSQCIYCTDAQMQAARSYFYPQVIRFFDGSFLDPPLAAFVLQPLALLPPAVGFAIFMMLSVVSVATSGWLIYRRILPPNWEFSARLLVIATCLTSASAMEALRVGQWAPLLLLPATAGVVYAQRGRPLVAGLLLSLLLLKPQLIWLLPIGLVGARQWRMLAGFALGAAGWIISTVVILGPAHLLDWPRAITANLGEQVGGSFGSISGTIADITSSTTAPLACLLCVAAVAAVLAIRYGRYLKGDGTQAIGIGIAASLATAPHIGSADLMLLGLPLCLWARNQPLAALVTAFAASAFTLAIGSNAMDVGVHFSVGDLLAPYGNLGEIIDDLAFMPALVVVCGLIFQFERRGSLRAWPRAWERV